MADNACMTEKIADKLTGSMVTKGLIDKEDQAIYAYNIRVMTEQITAFLLLILIGILTGSLTGSLVFLGVFFALRRCTGGYHCSSFVGCLLLSVITMIPTFLSGGITDCVTPWYYMLLLPSSAFIFMTGAVNHPSMDWSGEELDLAASHARRTLLTVLSVLILLFIAGAGTVLTFCLSRGIVLDAVSIIFAKISKQEVRHYEQ